MQASLQNTWREQDRNNFPRCFLCTHKLQWITALHIVLPAALQPSQAITPSSLHVLTAVFNPSRFWLHAFCSSSLSLPPENVRHITVHLVCHGMIWCSQGKWRRKDPEDRKVAYVHYWRGFCLQLQWFLLKIDSLLTWNCLNCCAAFDYQTLLLIPLMQQACTWTNTVKYILHHKKCILLGLEGGGRITGVYVDSLLGLCK